MYCGEKERRGTRYYSRRSSIMPVRSMVVESSCQDRARCGDVQGGS